MQQATRHHLHKGGTSTRSSLLSPPYSMTTAGWLQQPHVIVRFSCSATQLNSLRQSQSHLLSAAPCSIPSAATTWTAAAGAAAPLRRRSVRCFSTPGLQPPSNSHSISWLQDVQVLLPEPLTATPTDSSSSSSASNGNGNSSSSSYRPPKFKQLSEAQLSLDAGTSSSSSGSGGGSGAFDAIIVLAGGLTPDGGLPEWVHRRMDVARDLHLLQGRRPAIVCSGGGTPHKPSVLGPSGHVIHESTSGATYLIGTGVQPGAIYKEVSSFDTVGNAYFSLCIHAVPMAWRHLAVVTSDFHMPRSRALFADIYRLAGQSLFGDPNWFSLMFVSASDEGVFDDYVYNARLHKEAGSLAHWQRVSEGLTGFPAFHQWFFAEHLCYAVPRQHEFGKRTIQDQKLLDSY